jgi:hypothetical protein
MNPVASDGDINQLCTLAVARTYASPVTPSTAPSEGELQADEGRFDTDGAGTNGLFRQTLQRCDKHTTIVPSGESAGSARIR